MLARAHKGLTRAHAWRVKVYGSDDTSTLECARNLAISYRLLGFLKESTQLLRETWNAQKRVQGETHQQTLQTCTCLLKTMCMQGELPLDEARDICEKYLPISARVLGPDNIATRSFRGFHELLLKYPYCS